MKDPIKIKSSQEIPEEYVIDGVPFYEVCYFVFGTSAKVFYRNKEYDKFCLIKFVW